MKIAKYSLLAALLIPMVACADNRRLVSQDQARAVCTERALDFADTLRGASGEFPGLLQVQDFYRSCYHAKAGVNPPNKFALNQTKVFNLNKVLHK